MKWEYKVLKVDDILVSSHIDELQQMLNKYGEEGWELTAILNPKHSGKGWIPQPDTNLVILKKELKLNE